MQQIQHAITFYVPGHPTGKARAKAAIGPGGHATVYPDQRTVNDEWNFLGLARPFLPARPLTGAIELTIMAHVLVPKSASTRKRQRMLEGKIIPTKKPDADNLSKLVMDAMNGRFYLDDVQIADLVVRRRYAEAPGMTITLTPIGEEA
jgi:Holliday junction resolvase RusA-like endonuclease